MLTNKDWNAVNAGQRVLAKAIVRCQLGDIREEGPTDSRPKEGSPATTEEMLVVPMTLLQEAKTTDGDTVSAGFPLTGRFRIYAAKNGEPLADNFAKANSISEQRIKRLMLAGLGLMRNDKSDVQKTLIERGGWSALKDKQVLVDIDVTESKGTKYQEVSSFSMAPAATPANPF